MISKNKHFVVPYWYPKILYTTVRSFCAPHIQCTLKKNSLIFALFGHLWRPPHPKICIFTTALFFQKWSAHRALRPCTFGFFAKLIFFYVFTLFVVQEDLKNIKIFLKSPKKSGIRPKARRFQKTPRISNEKNYLNSFDPKCPQKKPKNRYSHTLTTQPKSMGSLARSKKPLSAPGLKNCMTL